MGSQQGFQTFYGLNLLKMLSQNKFKLKKKKIQNKLEAKLFPWRFKGNKKNVKKIPLVRDWRAAPQYLPTL